MKRTKVIQTSDITWEQHPQISGAEVAYLVSKRDDGADLTCMLVRPPAGSCVAKHTHDCEEIIYVIKGRAMMDIDGIGRMPLTAGTFLRIPEGVVHQPYEISEDFVAYDVFHPSLA